MSNWMPTQKEIEEDPGRCRFNCRTNREAFMDGWYAGTEYTMEQESSLAVKTAYKEWKRNET